jgi:hypothetical protein
MKNLIASTPVIQLMENMQLENVRAVKLHVGFLVIHLPEVAGISHLELALGLEQLAQEYRAIAVSKTAIAECQSLQCE